VEKNYQNFNLVVKNLNQKPVQNHVELFYGQEKEALIGKILKYKRKLMILLKKI